jgi:uncharacterized protein (DUF2141 family)
MKTTKNKLNILLTGIAFLSLLFSSFQKSNPQTGTIEIEVTGIKDLNNKNLQVGVFTKSGFPKNNKTVYNQIVKVSSKTHKLYFNIPPGTYAIALYHDLNNNNKIDKNFFGIPTEPYGFSNNFKPTLSEPSFSDCSFELGVNGKKITIDLIH